MAMQEVKYESSDEKEQDSIEVEIQPEETKAEVKEKNNKFSYNVSAYMNVKEVDPTRVEKLSRALKIMVGEYNREQKKKAKV